MRKKFLKSITEERENRIENKKKNNHKLLKFWNNFVNIKNNKKSLNLKIAFEMAKNFKYSHGNSSDNDYFFHPLRIANMSLFFSKKENDLLVLALLHNCLETTKVNSSFIKNLFGNQIFQEIKILTVNRKKQWNKKYKQVYYNKINNFSKNTKIIKILDKLDNLFVLNNNPDYEVKKKYLNEIKKYILPMIRKNTPFLNNYFNNLIKNTHLLMNKN
jgi:(p)ppGpp synthase/HD superfamily hydrolase